MQRRQVSSEGSGGLHLVEDLSRGWGVEREGDRKRVWARSKEQSDALQRGFALVAADPQEVPARLLDLISSTRAQHGPTSSPQEEQLYDAVDAGQLVVERLAYRVPPAVGAVTRQIGEVFDEADAYCRSDEHLLTMAADDETVRFHWWFLDQFTPQLAGRPPCRLAGLPRDVAVADHHVARVALRELERLEDEQPVPGSVADELRRHLEERVRRAHAVLGGCPGEDEYDDGAALDVGDPLAEAVSAAAVRRALLDAERTELLRLYAARDIDDEVLRTVQRQLDVEEVTPGV